MPEQTLLMIPLDEVTFHPHSFGDQNVRLFRWRGKLCRGISAQGVPFFQQLFKDGIIQHLTEKGMLIDSTIAPLSIDRYELVIQHRSLSFASYPNEWCGEMFKDAALTILNLAIELVPYGLTLGDAHPWNVLFDLETNKPVFVDLGSIVPIGSSTWSAYDEFCRYCLYPLLLMSHGQAQIARLLLCEDNGVLKSDLLRLAPAAAQSQSSASLPLLSQVESILRQILPQSFVTQLKKRLNSGRSPSGLITTDTLDKMRQNAHLRFLEKIRTEVEQISFPSLIEEMNAGEMLNTPLSPHKDWTVKQHNVSKILIDLHPTSVLDIGCGSGWYAKLAASLGSHVIAFDTNPNCVTQLYGDSCEEKLPILPLLMDFSKPTPARGLANHWAIAATERYPCDLVLALGVLHTLVLERRLNFSQIVEGLALFTKRWVCVEFIPREDPEVSEQWSERVSWYTLENFIAALEQKFSTITVLPSYPQLRILLLCEK